MRFATRVNIDVGMDLPVDEKIGTKPALIMMRGCQVDNWMATACALREDKGVTVGHCFQVSASGILLPLPTDPGP